METIDVPIPEFPSKPKTPEQIAQEEAEKKAWEEERKRTRKSVYPCVIVADRYTGSYSRGEWVAISCDPHCIPEGIDAGDNECGEFWDEHKDNPGIAVGATPSEAYENLKSKNVGYDYVPGFHDYVTPSKKAIFDALPPEEQERIRAERRKKIQEALRIVLNAAMRQNAVMPRLIAKDYDEPNTNDPAED